MLSLERAPTAFGEVSLRAESRLSRGEVLVTVSAPPRRPYTLLLRPPLPPGWRVVAAEVAGKAVSPARDGAVDLSEWPGRFTVRFRVEGGRPPQRRDR